MLCDPIQAKDKVNTVVRKSGGCPSGSSDVGPRPQAAGGTPCPDLDAGRTSVLSVGAPELRPRDRALLCVSYASVKH